MNEPLPDKLPFESILDSISDAIQIIDAEWNCFYINQAAADLGGKVARELRGKNVWTEFPELVGSPLEAACRRAMREQTRVDHRLYFSPSAKWLEIHLHPTPQYLTLYAIEIIPYAQPDADAERLAGIEALNARLQETNEALILSTVRQHEMTERAEILNARLKRAMQEAHHRVKNNLQVVSALVEIQLGEIGAAAGDVHLKRIIQHVRALSTIHDLLTQQAKDEGSTDYLSTREILERLIPLLQATSGGRSITADIEDVLLPTQKASSLSLLVSECVSNAVKHCTGGIKITLRRQGNRAHLEVCDHGNGFPPDFDWHKAAHTGLSLIDGTARHDLRGEVRYENHPDGGRVAISFPLPTQAGSNDAVIGSLTL